MNAAEAVVEKFGGTAVLAGLIGKGEKVPFLIGKRLVLSRQNGTSHFWPLRKAVG